VDDNVQKISGCHLAALPHLLDVKNAVPELLHQEIAVIEEESVANNRGRYRLQRL